MATSRQTLRDTVQASGEVGMEGEKERKRNDLQAERFGAGQAADMSYRTDTEKKDSPTAIDHFQRHFHHLHQTSLH